MEASRAARLPFATSHRSLACVARPRPALARMACTTSTTLATRGFGSAVLSKHERGLTLSKWDEVVVLRFSGQAHPSTPSILKRGAF